MSTVVETARELVRPGAVLDPGEIRTIQEAATAITSRGPRDDTDRKILAAAERLAFYPPTPFPQPDIPKELLDAITAAEAALGVEQAKVGQLLEEVVTARTAGNRAETPTQRERAGAVVRAAELLHAEGVAVKDKAGREVLHLRLQVEAIRRAFAMAQHASPSR